MSALDELERLLGLATPAPWAQGKTTPQNVSAGNALICRTFARSRAGNEDAVNAELIAALRNAAAELIRDARLWREHIAREGTK